METLHRKKEKEHGVCPWSETRPVWGGVHSSVWEDVPTHENELPPTNSGEEDLKEGGKKKEKSPAPQNTDVFSFITLAVDDEENDEKTPENNPPSFCLL